MKLDKIDTDTSRLNFIRHFHRDVPTTNNTMFVVYNSILMSKYKMNFSMVHSKFKDDQVDLDINDIIKVSMKIDKNSNYQTKVGIINLCAALIRSYTNSLLSIYFVELEEGVLVWANAKHPNFYDTPIQILKSPDNRYVLHPEIEKYFCFVADLNLNDDDKKELKKLKFIKIT